MNSFLKYIISFFLGIIIYLIFKEKDLIEGCRGRRLRGDHLWPCLQPFQDEDDPGGALDLYCNGAWAGDQDNNIDCSSTIENISYRNDPEIVDFCCEDEDSQDHSDSPDTSTHTETPENAFTLLSRIIGIDERGDSRTQYNGCQNYECHNRPKYTYDELNLKTLEELNGISDEELEILDKEKLIRRILQAERTNHYVDKEDFSNLNYLTCNNELNYSIASSLGERCNHENCCFNTKCSSQDVRDLDISDDDRCLVGDGLKKDANCLSKEQCQENYQLHCCTDTSSETLDEGLFNTIDTDRDMQITYTNLQNHLHNITTPQLDKLLATSSVNNIYNLQLDIHDFNDLINE